MNDKAGARRLSDLEAALLGLLHGAPRSGYALRRVFQDTPMGQFSDSPGSIYPALARLRARGLIAPMREAAPTRRPRERFAATRAGLDALRRWLAEPLTSAIAARGVDSAMLRFAFITPVLGRPAAEAFLADLGRVLGEHEAALRAWLRTHGPALPLEGRLAVGFGLDSVAAQRRWATRARQSLAAARGNGTPLTPDRAPQEKRSR